MNGAVAKWRSYCCPGGEASEEEGGGFFDLKQKAEPQVPQSGRKGGRGRERGRG